jgi:hypothetical protein
VASRFARYLRRLTRTVFILAILAVIVVAVQALYHPFDSLIAKGGALVEELDAKLSREAFNGITLGSLGLVLAICIFPIFLRRIDERAYGRGLWRGVISAAVFYLSNSLYGLASSLGRIHFMVAILGVIVVAAIVVEGVSLAVKEEEEKSFRTDIVASIGSGLLFGVLVKLGEFGIECLKKKVL